MNHLQMYVDNFRSYFTQKSIKDLAQNTNLQSQNVVKAIRGVVENIEYSLN